MTTTPSPIPTQLACMLVELDCLLDTRAGTLARMLSAQEYAKLIVGGYSTRISDEFPGIETSAFKQQYRERDAVTLSMSMITNIVSLVKDFAARVNVISASAPVSKIPRIDINVYPYNPPQKVLDNIKKAITVLIAERCDIGFVRYTPQDLGYDLVKFTYDHMVMYDVGDWLEAHALDWQNRKRGLPDVTVFCPCMYKTPSPENDPMKLGMIADDMCRTLTPILNMIQIPLSMFCQVVTDKGLREIKASPEAEAPEPVEKEVTPPHSQTPPQGYTP